MNAAVGCEIPLASIMAGIAEWLVRAPASGGGYRGHGPLKKPAKKLLRFWIGVNKAIAEGSFSLQKITLYQFYLNSNPWKYNLSLVCIANDQVKNISLSLTEQRSPENLQTKKS